MSQYSASLPMDIRRQLIREHLDFEGAIDQLLTEVTCDAPDLPPLHQDYHAAADRFARTVTQRRAPKCTIFAPPADPWFA
jgi:hypothetical protein